MDCSFLKTPLVAMALAAGMLLMSGCTAEPAITAAEPKTAAAPASVKADTKSESLAKAEPSPPASLEQQLLAESTADLAAAARAHGDPRQGAMIFYQPHLACTKCHVAGTSENPLGPDLARLPDDVTAEHLVESVLRPSQAIRRGYEPIVIVLVDGTALTGFLVEETDESLIVRDVGQNGRRRTIPLDQIEDRGVSTTSAMPTAQVNLLGGRQPFLDLLAYLIAIAENGPERAAALRPPGAPLGPPPIAPDTSGSQPQVYRTMMPESGPAALAIGLGHDVWVCFDPQRGGINYAWSGTLDLSPTVAQKINTPAIVEGNLFFRDATSAPLRTGDRERTPRVRFRGYRFVDGGVTLRYQVDEVAVSEHLTALPDGTGLLRRFEFAGPATALWLQIDKQPNAEVTVEPAEREGDGWRLDLGQTRSAAMRMELTKGTP